MVPVASVLDEVLDLVGILLSATATGSGLAITIGVLEERPLSEIEELGFLGTAGGFLVGVLTVTMLLILRAWAIRPRCRRLLQTMSFKTTPTVGLSKRTIVLLASLGVGLGVFLGAVDVPLWVYYLAPISMAPILVPELRHRDLEGTRRGQGDRR